MKRQLQPQTPAALYARISSDRQSVDLSVAAQLGAQGLRQIQRLLRGPGVRGRGRERQNRRPAPIPQNDRRERQGRPVAGHMNGDRVCRRVEGDGRPEAQLSHRDRFGDRWAKMTGRFSKKSKRRRTVVWATLAYLAMILLTGASCIQRAPAVQWGYDGPGAPEHWASLSEEYATCAAGRRQSPIDITGDDRGDASPLSFAYEGNATAVRNDGRFVHVDYEDGNNLRAGQRTYALKSAHLHSPSEHLIDGASFAAELHLVHADGQGNLAVVGVLFSLGAPDPGVQEILDAAPAAGDTVVQGFELRAAGFVPGELDHYRYVGSKTTPPCDEPVDWYVMRQPQTISQEQVDGLLRLSGGPNNRPVQPIWDRAISTPDLPPQRPSRPLFHKGRL